jgi:hypothetical protein
VQIGTFNGSKGHLISIIWRIINPTKIIISTRIIHVLGPLITFSTNHVSATAGIAITPITISNRGDSVSHYSIYPAIPDGLSLNAKTGAISGVPIVASDPVTYTVTAVGHRGHDTATIVIAVGVGVINLALRKPATQSSTYLYHSIDPVAGYAVDGNTDGYFLNKSTTHTKFEDDNPWWQVDLGSKKDIEQIIIYNRTDCCADRLRVGALDALTPLISKSPHAVIEPSALRAAKECSFE